MKRASFKAKLPDNIQPSKLVRDRDLILRYHSSGLLFKVHQYIAMRLHAYDAEVDDEGAFFLTDERKSDNAIWLLLRGDVESQNYDIPQHLLRKVVQISLDYIRKHAPKDLARGERAVIISLRDEL
jgi:hypothetical protein